MWKQIKEINFKAINEEIETIRLAKARVDELEDKINTLNEEIASESSKQKVSIFRRIFRRREYKRTLMLLSQTISSKKEEIEKIEQELDETKSNIDELKLQNLKETFEKLKNATCLEDMSYTTHEALALLEERNIPIILEKNEKIEQNDEKIRDESDVVLIHKTNYMPKSNQIQTYKSVVRYKEKVIFGEDEYEISYPEGRNTIHFSANHEVTAHLSGSWSTKYAIIIPFSDIPKDRIGSACSVDTFVKGNVQLNNNAYILCPIGQGKIVRESNPNAKVIEYDGELVDGFANSLISYLGYPVKKASSVSWHDLDEQKKYDKMMHDKGLITYLHSGTKEGLTEDEDTKIYKFSSILRLIKDQKLIDKIGVNQIIKDIKSQNLLSLTHGIQVEDAMTRRNYNEGKFFNRQFKRI